MYIGPYWCILVDFSISMHILGKLSCLIQETKDILIDSTSKPSSLH
jgi:hypothetical protein